MEWTPSFQVAFEEAKAALVAAVPLHYPYADAELSLHVNASSLHIGAVLQQYHGQLFSASGLLLQEAVLG